jgi:endonuclease VIII
VPEGDSVFRAARRLDAATAGALVTTTDMRRSAVARVDLTGARILGWVPRGKHLLCRLDDGRTLHSHLRMQGAWQLHDPVRRWPRRVDHEVRGVLSLDTVADGPRLLVAWRMPVLEVLPTRDEAQVVGHLGPDLLGEGWDADEALRRLRADPVRPVVAALLDQRNLAGLGNLWAVELAFTAAASPWTPVAEVGDLPGALDRAHRWLARAIVTGRMTTTGNDRKGHDHWVYGRWQRPCRRCGTPIAFAPFQDSPSGREVWWCPRCQPGAPEAAVAASAARTPGTARSGARDDLDGEVARRSPGRSVARPPRRPGPNPCAS